MIYYDETSEIDPEGLAKLEIPKVEGVEVGSTPAGEHNTPQGEN